MAGQAVNSTSGAATAAVNSAINGGSGGASGLSALSAANPYGAMIGAAAGVADTAIKETMKDTTPMTGTASSQTNFNNGPVSINFGSGSQTSTANPSNTQSQTPAAAGVMAGMTTEKYIMWGVGGLALLVILKRAKKG